MNKNEQETRTSKSQRKRDMSELLSLVRELELLPMKQLDRTVNQELKEKLIELKKITKGNAKKRQRQP